MDGVLANFEKRWIDLFETSPNETRSKKKFIKKSFPLDKNIQIVNTGTNTSIALRIHKIKKLIKSENFLLLNGDAIFDFNLDNIFKNNEWRIRDTSLANKMCTWIKLYAEDGNLAAFNNFCKLKVMTHNGGPIYSIEEQEV